MPRHSSKNFTVTPKEPRRVKRPPPAVLAPRTEPLSDAEELALALVLWKSLRCHGSLAKNGHSFDLPTRESVAFGEMAIRLAKLAGVKAEFLAMLFSLDLVKVTLTRMET